MTKRASLTSVKNSPPRPHPVEEVRAVLSNGPDGPRSEEPEAPVMADPPIADLIEAGKGTTVHLTRHSARMLKTLAAEKEKTVHALMIEGVNLVFEKYGLPQLAQAGMRSDAARKKASKQAR